MFRSCTQSIRHSDKYYIPRKTEATLHKSILLDFLGRLDMLREMSVPPKSIANILVMWQFVRVAKPINIIAKGIALRSKMRTETT